MNKINFCFNRFSLFESIRMFDLFDCSVSEWMLHLELVTTKNSWMHIKQQKNISHHIIPWCWCCTKSYRWIASDSHWKEHEIFCVSSAFVFIRVCYMCRFQDILWCCQDIPIFPILVKFIPILIFFFGFFGTTTMTASKSTLRLCSCP